MFVKAVYYRDQKTVHYFDEDGNETLYIGGSFAWRMNNPGNMGKPGKRVVSTYIGLAQRTDEPYLFLIFPDKKTGDMERARLLKDVYGKSTVSGMIESYAPKKHGNDPVAYTAMITKETGIAGSAIVGELNDTQFDALLKVMQKKEGYLPGKIIELGKPSQVTLQDKLKQPMGDQKVQVKGGSKTVELKTDEHGSMPAVYSKLLGGNAELVHVQSSCTKEKIGQVSASSEAQSTTFSAPYFLSKSKPNVHEVEEKAPRKVHIVKAGESLTGIASQYPGVTVEALVKENGLKDANRIFERQHLRIPGGAGPAEPSERPAAAGAPAAAAKSPAPVASAPASKPPPAQTKPPAQEKKQTPPVPAAPKAAVTVDQQRTDKNHPVTVLSTPALEPSGPQWHARFTGSSSLDELNDDFRPKAQAFDKAMRAAGITVRVNVTYRPVERSYLMYHAFQIAKGGSPVGIQAWPGVNIDWAHKKSDGTPDLVEAKKAAVAMCAKYGLKINSSKQKVGKPKNSNHNKRSAVDMKITGYEGKTIVDNAGAKIKIKKFSDLVAVGASYGVIYYPDEDMHWSHNGR